MRRVILIALLSLLACLCAAQQPDVRVQLWTLFQPSQIELLPAGKMKVTWGEGHSLLDQPAVIRAHGDAVELSGHTTATLLVSGDFRMVAERAPVQHIRSKVEISAKDGIVQVIVSLPFEDYVVAVLQGETAGNMPAEALKAMAVSIRSYTSRFRERHKDDGFDFCDTTHCQFLRLNVQPAVSAAVKATAGELLWDRGTPLAAYYHKDCGGQTESAAAAWHDQKSTGLMSHEDIYCVRVTQPWRSEIAQEDLERALSNAGLHVPTGWNRVAISERTPSGRAKILRVSIGNSAGVPISASSFHFAVGRSLGWNTLKSDWYDVTVQGGRFIFSGKGVGHGVGLCQTGAAEMARQGKSYREILAFYYPTALPGRSAQGIPWITSRDEAFELHMVNSSDSAIAHPVIRSALDWAKQQTGLNFSQLPIVEVYPTVAMFRDATGEPGWIAASTRREHIRIQPIGLLHERFENVLRHEFLHMLVESNAKANTPLWFREGLVVYLGGDPAPANEVKTTTTEIEQIITSRGSQVDVHRAYAQAAGLVRNLDRQNGRGKLIEWLQSGLPDNLASPIAQKVGH
ncbi:MAG TPA: SpoIID/LytB domain-containing protein [Terriglobales bacterium]